MTEKKVNKVVNTILKICIFIFLAVLSVASLHILIIMALIGTYTITKQITGGTKQ